MDNIKNFAYGIIAVAPSPNDSGELLVLAPGQGADFPEAPFNVLMWPSNVIPRSFNAEVGRCTAIDGDTLTVTRAQSGTMAKPIAVGYQICQPIDVDLLMQMLSNLDPLPKAGGTMTGPIIGLEDKGGQVFNVKAFGAVGDGTTNDAADMQTAINTPGSQGGIVLAPPAVYKVNSQLTIPSNLSWQSSFGVSNKGANILWGGTTGTVGVLKIFDSHFINIDGISISDTNEANASTAILIDSDNTPATFHVELRHFAILQFGTGIQIGQSVASSFQMDKIFLEHGYIQNCLTGIRVQSSNALDSGEIRDVEITQGSTTDAAVGYLIDAAGNFKITDSVGGFASATATFIKFINLKSATLIENCEAEGPAGFKFLWLTSAMSGDLFNPITMNQCTCDGTVVLDCGLNLLNIRNTAFNNQIIVNGNGNRVSLHDNGFSSTLSSGGLVVNGNSNTFYLGNNPGLVIVNNGTGNRFFYEHTSAGNVAISAATTITPSQYGQEFVCTAISADYTVALPTPASMTGQQLTLRMNSGNTFLVTLSTGTGIIDGQATRIMMAGESVVLESDGTNWCKISGKTILMQGAIYKGSAQSIPTGAVTGITLDTALYDNVGASKMVVTASNQLKVLRPGRYTVIGRLAMQGAPAASARVLGVIQKNAVNAVTFEMPASIGTFLTNAVTDDLTLAAGDLLTLQMYQASGSAWLTNAGAVSGSCALILREVLTW